MVGKNDDLGNLEEMNRYCNWVDLGQEPTDK